MAAIYHPGVVTIIPKYDIGHPTNAANVTQWQTAAVGLTTAQLTAIQTAFDNAWSAWWKALAYTANKYTGSWVIDSSSATGGQVTNATYSPVAGTLTGVSAYDNTAALLSLKTALRYRGGHGRLYIPGFANSSTNLDGSTIPPATITAMQNGWDSTVAALVALSGAAGGPLNPIVWHKRLSSAPNTVEAVTGRVAQPVLATQRRRLRKVSRHRRRVA